jgi:DNA polymerase elongation subunit (family B)
MRSDERYMCVVKGTPTMLSVIIDDLIRKRKKTKSDGQPDKACAYKLLLVSVDGSMPNRYGIISSKTCAEITTYLARYYLRPMNRAAKGCGCETHLRQQGLDIRHSRRQERE